MTNADVTRFIQMWKAGDAAALDQVTVLLQEELHRIASRYMRSERQGHTLQATALVNEAWLRMASLASLDWKDRAHFIGIAARIMRQILLQHARARSAEKRGGGGSGLLVTLDADAAAGPRRDEEVIALDEALSALAALDGRKSHLLELRYFGGLEIQEIAAVTGESESTVKRQLRLAQAWLHRYLTEKQPNA